MLYVKYYNYIDNVVKNLKNNRKTKNENKKYIKIFYPHVMYSVFS